MPFQSPVLILGAGINGAALARELVLNGMPVVVVDTRDLAAGTTAYSSRLIHGGLRYLEYGDFDLVRESLAERTRWLRLAPHLVRPLRLSIPVESRFGGFAAAVRNFVGLRPKRARRSSTTKRGLWTIRAGLWLYDRYARDRLLPPHSIGRLLGDSMPAVDPSKYRWICSYHDAQIRFPERFTLELLLDARNVAGELGVEFSLYTYHRAVRRGNQVDITAFDGSSMRSLAPAAIINATGAWVDYTLADFDVPSKRLIGGTKGSHFVTYHRGLIESLGEQGVYAEASDGRPIFILPFGDGVLVGTTDEPFAGDPDSARATLAELQYLMEAVHDVFPQVTLGEPDIELVYSGVRPLPASGPATPAAITRKHWLQEHALGAVACFSIVGGKLTTCRSLAETAARTILGRLGREPSASSRDRELPGARDTIRRTREHDAFEQEEDSVLSARFNLSQDSIRALRDLYGYRLQAVVGLALEGEAIDGSERQLLDHTPYPLALARYMIAHEWVRRLDDFVERRLMLLYHRPLTRRCLEQLADVLVSADILDAANQQREIEATIERLRERFRKRVT